MILQIIKTYAKVSCTLLYTTPTCKQNKRTAAAAEASKIFKDATNPEKVPRIRKLAALIQDVRHAGKPFFFVLFIIRIKARYSFMMLNLTSRFSERREKSQITEWQFSLKSLGFINVNDDMVTKIVNFLGELFFKRIARQQHHIQHMSNQLIRMMNPKSSLQICTFSHFLAK